MSREKFTVPANDYVLTESDLEERPTEQLDFHPVIRAAVNSDPRVLLALLSLPDAQFDALTSSPPNATFTYDSALLAAINAGLRTNVELLLAHGADPNGLPSEALSHWSARFLRFRPHFSMTDSRTREVVLGDIPTALNRDVNPIFYILIVITLCSFPSRNNLQR
jgi:hypothetical protein